MRKVVMDSKFTVESSDSNKTDVNYIITFPEYPGLTGGGDTIDEALHIAREALDMWLDIKEEEARNYVKPREKLYKVIVYLTDFNEGFNPVDELDTLLGNDKYLYGHIGYTQTVEIDWNDDIDINKIGATTETYEKYFTDKREVLSEEDK